MSSAVFETNAKYRVLIEPGLQKTPAMDSGYSPHQGRNRQTMDRSHSSLISLVISDELPNRMLLKVRNLERQHRLGFADAHSLGSPYAQRLYAQFLINASALPDARSR